MNGKLIALTDWGCSTDSALDRMLGDEDLYLEFLTEFTKDTSFDMLSDALCETKNREAFEHAHMLKGVAANLGLDPLYKALYTVTEALREEPDFMKAREGFTDVESSLKTFRNIMGTIV